MTTSVAQLEAILRQSDRLLTTAENRVIKLMERTLRARLAELEARLRRLDRQQMDGIVDTSKREARARMLVTQLQSALGAFALGDPKTGVTDALRQEIIESQRIGIETASKLLKKYDGELDLRSSVDLDAVKAATENTKARLDRYSGEFAQTAEDLVVRGLVQGEGPRKTAARLREETGQLLWQSERITRTETIRSHDQSSRATYKRNGMDLVQVCETLDDRVCGFCASRHMNVYKADECPLPQHPQCRGSALPWRQEWLDEGLVSLEDIQNSKATILARTKDKLRTGQTPAEKFDGRPAAKPVWKVPPGGTATPQTEKEKAREATRAERRSASRDEDKARRIRLGQRPDGPDLGGPRRRVPTAPKPAPVVPPPPKFADLVKAEIGAGVKTTDDALRVGKSVRSEWDKRPVKSAPLLQDAEKRYADLIAEAKATNAEIERLSFARQDALARSGFGPEEKGLLALRNAQYGKLSALSDVTVIAGKDVNRLKTQVGLDRQKVLTEVLSEIRPLGGVPQTWAKGSNKEARARIEEVLKSYPKDWLQKSVDAGPLLAKKVARGYHRHSSTGPTTIALSGRGDAVAFHEMGHRFERVVAELLKLEQEFYAKRTAGETLQRLGAGYKSGEVTRKDQFVDPYIGKDYGGRAYELLSMGFESVYTGSYDLKKDPEMLDWILGILAGV